MMRSWTFPYCHCWHPIIWPCSEHSPTSLICLCLLGKQTWCLWCSHVLGSHLYISWKCSQSPLEGTLNLHATLLWCIKARSCHFCHSIHCHSNLLYPKTWMLWEWNENCWNQLPSCVTPSSQYSCRGKILDRASLPLSILHICSYHFGHALGPSAPC